MAEDGLYMNIKRNSVNTKKGIRPKESICLCKTYSTFTSSDCEFFQDLRQRNILPLFIQKAAKRGEKKGLTLNCKLKKYTYQNDKYLTMRTWNWKCRNQVITKTKIYEKSSNRGCKLWQRKLRTHWNRKGCLLNLG